MLCFLASPSQAEVILTKEKIVSKDTVQNLHVSHGMGFLFSSTFNLGEINSR